MITRAVLSLALVWLCQPHHPDLGLAVADACAGQACIAVSAHDSEREVIFQRLREVRNEIRGGKAFSVRNMSASLGVFHGGLAQIIR